MVGCSIDYRPVAKKKHHDRKDRERERGWRQDTPFKGTPAMTYILQQGPTSE
jgi:hypothetical protein